MASSFPLLSFLFLSLFAISATSRPTPSLSSSQPPVVYGPITTNGRNYTHVCDPDRFADLGLDINDFAYCDKTLSYADRVKTLVGSMSLGEKIRQLGNKAYGVERIGLPMYEWWSEALHGVSDQGRGVKFDDVVPHATSFPTVILTTSSFNESLWNNIGKVVSTEARAMYNLGHAGLTFWSPTMNVVRDPRWGRTLETPGEDPFVVGKYSVNYVRGLQDVENHVTVEDQSTRPLKVSACCKHFAAYDVDNWFGIVREEYDARVAEQDMVETFNLPFEMCIKDGDVSSIMCSYNRLNGIPTCADPKLLSQTIRGEWNLNGYIVSDCDSIQVIQNRHKWLGDTMEDAVSQVLDAGLDLDCGESYTNYTESAVQQGKVREKDIDNALKNLYQVLMRLGYFDGLSEYKLLGKSDICSQEHIDLAADAARQGIVLLKNENNALPLSKDKHKTLAVGGPHADAQNAMVGNYAGKPCRFITPHQGLSADAKVDAPGPDHLKAAATHNDATIVFVGLNQHIEYEGQDRWDLLLPEDQIELINNVSQASKGPFILVIFSAGGIDITFAKNNPNISAIIWAGYPGAEGGRAIADVIYGRYNPGGRLPVTWYENDYTEALPMTSMRLRPIPELGYPGRTYKFYEGPRVYPFGYGLSYTKFNYSVKPITSSITQKLGTYQQCMSLDYKPGAVEPPCPAVDITGLVCDDEISFEVTVMNTGKVDGHDVVMVYAKPPGDVLGAPTKKVVAFQRVFVRAGESETVKFTINACKSLALVEKTAYTVLASGEHKIVIGDSDYAVSFPLEVKLSY